MIGLKQITHITRTDSGFVTHSLQGNWQGINAIKAAALGNVPNDKIIVRIPLDILGDVKIKKGDFIVLGEADISGMNEKQIFATFGSDIIKVNAVRLCDGLSKRVNHLEVSGA